MSFKTFHFYQLRSGNMSREYTLKSSPNRVQSAASAPDWIHHVQLLSWLKLNVRYRPIFHCANYKLATVFRVLVTTSSHTTMATLEQLYLSIPNRGIFIHSSHHSRPLKGRVNWGHGKENIPQWKKEGISSASTFTSNQSGWSSWGDICELTSTGPVMLMLQSN